MSNFCIVCTPRSGSYYFFEYMSKTFDLVEGTEWFGRNKSVDLTKPFDLITKRVDIDWTKNEDLLTEQDIQRRLRHLENFPLPYCIKTMPLQLTNTPTQCDWAPMQRVDFATQVLKDFDLVWFVREDKVSHFCFELTAMHCSQPDYPRDREYCTYDPPSRRTPPPNSFTATYEDYKKYMFREDITEQVMKNFDAPVISYEWFVEDQDETMLRIQEHYGIKANFREENKKEIIENPDYSKIFTNYEEIELWFH